MATAHLNLITDVVQDAARPVAGATRDYDPLLELIGEARFCLPGEATHGTPEFYRERAEITRRLRLRTTGRLFALGDGRASGDFPDRNVELTVASQLPACAKRMERNL